MRRTLLTASFAGAVALISLWLAPGALALFGPTVTLTSPAQNAVIAGGQPTFSGTASNGPASRVIVGVYRGAVVNSSALFQTEQTFPSANTRYSVGPKAPLPDGQYTAQAQQSNPVGTGFSPAVSFIVHNALPAVSLAQPPSTPFLTPTPTLTGTAGTSFGDQSGVEIIVYPGSGTSQGAIQYLFTKRSQLNGSFSVQVPDLPDGQYTVVADQIGLAGTATSAPQTFRIKANAPQVTLDQPQATTSNAQPRFSGAAGDVLGDSGQVTVSLYTGSSTAGSPIGSFNVPRNGGGWSGSWPTPLEAGTYTAQASQPDDVGHTGLSARRSFVIISSPSVIGSRVKLKHGIVSVSVKCGLPAGDACAGTVLILTLRKFRPVASGPTGQLRLMFAYVSIPGGRASLISRRVPVRLARILRRAGTVRVRVRTALGAPRGSGATQAAIRRLRH